MNNRTAESIPINAGSPPVAERRPHTLEAHGMKREDPYYWLRDDRREDPEVLAYLEAENAYVEQLTEPLAGLEQQLYQELIARIPANDESVPFRLHGYWYARQYREGKELPVHVRWSRGEQQPEGEPEILLDENQLKGELEFYQVGDFDVSPDGVWLAWSEDVLSRGVYQLKFRDLEGNSSDDSVLEGVGPEVLFANDNRTVFYVRLEPGTLIPNQVWRHQLGTSVSDDVLVYQESDPAYVVTIKHSRDHQHIIIELHSTLTSEAHWLDAGHPERSPQVVVPRLNGHEYSLETLGGQAFLLTNREAKNFRIIRTSLEYAADLSTWREILPENPQALISDFAVFDQHVVASVVENANQILRVIPHSGDQSWDISADEPGFAMHIGVNPSSATSLLRYTYESPATPLSWYQVDMRDGRRELLKRSFAGQDFAPSAYQVTRLSSTARDGSVVPVTLLHRRDVRPDGQPPLYLLGYGSYGYSYLPGFQPQMLSLVERGYVFGLAHIRGGQELGRDWYEQGKLLHKQNTFTDFIDVGRDLIKRGWAAPDKLIGSGRSAGGLLIGAVANMAPETFRILVAGVPFVDVVTTMLDDSIPLTTFEFDEWGDPRDQRYYDYMLAYSPYDQVTTQDYPHLYVTTGLWDPAVQYWEPAKWVARLRARKTDDNLLLLRTDMHAGHRGGAGRFERQREVAREFALILHLLDQD